MKKLLMGFAVCASLCASAATYKWTTEFAVADTTLDGITTATYAYLIDANVLSQEAVWNAVSGGSSLSSAVDGKTLAGTAMSKGLIAAQTGSLSSDYKAGDSLSAYMVLFDAGIGENGSLYFSEQLTKLVDSTQDTKFFLSSDSSVAAAAADMKGFNTANGGWVNVTSDVPEPTSGMLLLLGMAGLALKRKRA